MFEYFKKEGRKEIFIILLITIGFLLRIFLTNCYYWDESIYLQHAEIFSGKIDNYNEFDLRPPILPLIISGLYTIWHNPLIANLFVSFISAFSILIIYLLGKEIFNKKVGFIAAVILTFFPLHIYLSRQLLVHTLALFFGMLSLLFLKKGENNSKNYFFIFSGIALALSILTRFTYLIFIFVFCLNFILFFRKYKFTSILSFGAGFILTILPYLVWAYVRFGDFLYPFKTARLVTDWSSHEPWNFYLVHPFMILSCMGIVGIILWLFFKFKEINLSKNEIFLISLFLFPLGYLTYMPHKELRFLTITLISLILLAAVGFARLLDTLKNKGIFILLFLILIIAGLFTFNYDPYPRDCNSDVKFVSNWINLNIEINQTLYVQDFYPYFGYYTKNKIIIAPLARERFFNVSNFFNETGYLIYFPAQQNNPNFPKLFELENDSRFDLISELKNKEQIYVFRVN